MVASRSGPDPTRARMKGYTWDPEYRVHYPESDDEPLADTQTNGAEMVRITETLQDFFADRPDVYVWMNLFVYYERGNAKAVVAPDVFVAIGADKEPWRRIYQVWEEAVPPTVVFELTSSSTHQRDLDDKREIYARMGVAEYFLYDPDGEYVRERLRGFRLVDGTYQPLVPEPDGALVSEGMGLWLVLRENRLQFIDPRTGARLLSPRERADAEKARADAAERRIAELLAQLAARGQPEPNGDQHGAGD